MHQRINAGEGDIIACNYTVTMDRKDDIDFTDPILKTPQVLIQRKESDPKLMKQHPLITSTLQLARKKVFVWEGSSYFQRLVNLQQEIGDTIFINPTQSHEGVEELIEMVSNGQIDYTVVEKNVADINCRFYDNIDASLKISFDQKIAFGVNKKAGILKSKFNEWLAKFKKNELYAFIQKKYFSQPQVVNETEFSNVKVKKGSISPFDGIIQAEASKYNFEWQLLAAIIHQESKFNPNAQGFGGAYGLMQFMPGTGPQYNVYPSSPAAEQIAGGMKYVNRLMKIWSKIPDPEQRYKFMLASYNAGPGHVIDAYKLAEKHGLNPKMWDNNVGDMVINLGKKEFYTDEVVKSGACHGQRTFNYVSSVIGKYKAYSGK
jgi:membrane-bound lytic murein transglycosylase F